MHGSKILFVLKVIYLSNGGLSGYGWPGHETGYSGLWVSHDSHTTCLNDGFVLLFMAL